MRSRSDPIQLIRPDPIRSDLIRSDLIRSNRSDPIRSDPFDPIQWIRFDRIRIGSDRDGSNRIGSNRLDRMDRIELDRLDRIESDRIGSDGSASLQDVATLTIQNKHTKLATTAADEDACALPPRPLELLWGALPHSLTAGGLAAPQTRFQHTGAPRPGWAVSVLSCRSAPELQRDLRGCKLSSGSSKEQRLRVGLGVISSNRIEQGHDFL